MPAGPVHELDGRPRFVRAPLATPLHELDEHRHEVPSPLRQQVLRARRMFLVGPLVQDARIDEPVETGLQHERLPRQPGRLDRPASELLDSGQVSSSGQGQALRYQCWARVS